MESPSDETLAKSGNKRPQFSRPWVLSRILFLRIGFNGLGAIELAIAFLPVLIWTATDRPFTASSRYFSLLAAIAATALDVWWRASNDEVSGWRKALSPMEGGALMFVPGWLFGLALLVLYTLALAGVAILGNAP